MTKKSHRDYISSVPERSFVMRAIYFLCSLIMLLVLMASMGFMLLVVMHLLGAVFF